MSRELAAVAAAIYFLFGSQISHGEEADLVVKKSSGDFVATVQRLQTEIQSRGATIIATVDHAAAAKGKQLELRPTTVVMFGNPILGTPLMMTAQTAGIDLPLRVLVWEDADNNVQIGYRPPSLIADDHGAKNQEDVIAQMASALDAITDAAAAQ